MTCFKTYEGFGFWERYSVHQFWRSLSRATSAETGDALPPPPPSPPPSFSHQDDLLRPLLLKNLREIGANINDIMVPPSPPPPPHTHSPVFFMIDISNFPCQTETLINHKHLFPLPFSLSTSPLAACLQLPPLKTKQQRSLPTRLAPSP
jgi:hypothetical protein